jgi:hypothetical protein
VKPTREKRRLKNNPWELLVVAALFFFPGVFMLLQHGPLIAVQQVYRYTYLLPSGVTAISEHGAHVFGALAIGVGFVFILFYLYLRRVIARSTPHVVEHGREQI